MFGKPRGPRTRIIFALAGSIAILVLFALSDLPFVLVVPLVAVQWLPVVSGSPDKGAAARPNQRAGEAWLTLIAAAGVTVLLAAGLVVWVQG